MEIRKVFDNIEIKIVCLLLAVVMWLYVAKPKGTEAIDKLMAVISRGDRGKITFRKIPVKLIGSREQWELTPSEITLEVKCLLTAEVEVRSFQAIVNLTRKNEAERRVTLTAENVVLPQGLTFVRAEPNEIRLSPML